MIGASVARVQALLDGLSWHDQVTRRSDEPPLWTAQLGATTVLVLATADAVVARARIADRLRPDDAVLQEALLSGHVEMRGAFFTLEASGALLINQALPLEGLAERALDLVLHNVAAQAEEWDARLREALDAATSAEARLKHLLARTGLPREKIASDPPTWSVLKGDWKITASAAQGTITLTARLAEKLEGVLPAILDFALAANGWMRGAFFAREADGSLTLSACVPLLAASATTFPWLLDNLAQQLDDVAPRLRLALAARGSRE
jgi:Tir chaperone family protein CesT